MKTLSVAELIEALMKIEDKTIPIVFYCPRCKEMNEIESMKSFGFVVPK